MIHLQFTHKSQEVRDSQQPGRTVQKPKLLCLYYLLSDFNYTDEATVLKRTIHHAAWVFAVSVALSVPW